MNIGLCDDEPMVLILLESLINKCLLQLNQTNVSIYKYVSGNVLLSQVSFLDMVFLDIDMPEINGIELGRKIHTYNPDCCIVMATCRDDCYKQAFHINAFRFVTKPFDTAELNEALISYFRSCIGMNQILVYEDRNSFYIYEKDIIYISAYNGYVEVISKNQKFRKDSSLNELEALLDSRIFYRIDRKYLINMLHISGYQNGTIHISNLNLEVSRRRKKNFEQKYIEYDLKYTRNL